MLIIIQFVITDKVDFTKKQKQKQYVRFLFVHLIIMKFYNTLFGCVIFLILKQCGSQFEQFDSFLLQWLLKMKMKENLININLNILSYLNFMFVNEMSNSFDVRIQT